MKIYISHSSEYDYTNLIYNPIKSSRLVLGHNVFLPHDQDTIINSKETIKHQDVLIAEVSLPSTGQGIEIGWADSFGIPIICLCREGKRYSSSLKFIAKDVIEYKDSSDIARIITNLLDK